LAVLKFFVVQKSYFNSLFECKPVVIYGRLIGVCCQAATNRKNDQEVYSFYIHSNSCFDVLFLFGSMGHGNTGNTG
jgi:hypothetical protein